jgi:Domain of unknown function (DUF5666)
MPKDPNLSRRRMLQALIIGPPAFSLLRLRPAHAETPFTPTLGSGMSTKFPTTFEAGNVLAKDATGVTLQGETGPSHVTFTPATTVWKEVETTADVIEVGDLLYIRAVETPPVVAGQREFEALRVWVNIGWYHGRIKSVAEKSIVVAAEHRKGSLGERTVHLSDFTILFEHQKPAARYRRQLAAGQWVDALGVFVPGGDLRATRMWVN